MTEAPPLAPLAPTAPLSTAQLAFLFLHTHHVVTSWQWRMMETNLVARTDRGRTATIWCAELDELVALGLVSNGHGVSVYVTAAGRLAIETDEVRA